MRVIQSKFLVWWLCIFTLFYIPFNFSSWMFNALPLVSVRLMMTLFIVGILSVHKILVSKSEFLFLTLSLFYIVLECTYNASYNKAFINDVIFYIFCITYYIVQKKNPTSQKLLIKMWANIIAIASVSSVLASVFYLLLPSVFFAAGYDGYSTVINPLGFIHVERDGFRPSWFFAEPSYLGFYLGANLLFVYHYYKDALPKYAFLSFFSIYILSCFIVQSGTIVVSLTFSFVAYFVHNHFIRSVNKSFWALVILLIIILVVVLELDLIDLYTNYDLLSSLGDRQSRMLSSADVYRDMSSYEYLLGKGSSYVTSLFERGESNVYYKVFIEQGSIALFLFLIYVKHFLQYSLFALFFVIIAFNSTICHFSPLTYFCFLSLYFYYKDRVIGQAKKVVF